MPNLNQPTEISLATEWEDPRGASCEELRATWCRLSIRVGQSVLTRVLDESAQSVRDAIYAPAYPLAEWIALNWWPLMTECRSEPASGANQRHNLRFAAEGFAWPDLEFVPEGRWVRAVWKPYAPTSSRVRFLEEGFAVIEKKALAKALTEFVDRVMARLELQNVGPTALVEEWAAIRQANSEETAFCEAAGAMGLDPYNLPDPVADRLTQVSAMLPSEVLSEFFSAASSDQVHRQAAWIQGALQKLAKRPLTSRLKGWLGRYRDRLEDAEPWRQGYLLAHDFRQDAKLKHINSPLKLEQVWGTSEGRLPVVVVAATDPVAEAIARFTNAQGPVVLMPRRREESRRFALARSLCEYLCAAHDGAALLTTAATERQKRTRAFAAELLAPADGIRGLLSRARVSGDEIAEIAAHFRVSDWVIRHQLENHGLATAVS